MKIRAFDKQANKYLEGDYAAEYAHTETDLIYCDLEGIVIGETGAYLLDECGSWAYLSEKRFRIEIEWEG